MQLTEGDFEYLGRIVESFFFGLYSGIFALHLQYYISKKEPDNTSQNIIFYALCILYVFTLVVNVLDIASGVVFFSDEMGMGYCVAIAQSAVFGCCDFIAQSILIHRCWIVWGRNIHVVIIPSILAFAYLVIWMAGIAAEFIGHGVEIDAASWGNTLDLTSLTASMTVNALVTGLIVFKIFKVFREVKSITTTDEKCLGVTGGRKLRAIIFIIIESGMALFAIQLTRVSIVAIGAWTDAAYDAYTLIASIHLMLNGIAPTIILVRVSMGLSFHDEPSLVEAIGSLEFAANDSNAIPEMVNISQERRNDDIGGDDNIQLTDG